MSIRTVTWLLYDLAALVGFVAALLLAQIHPALMLAPFAAYGLILLFLLRCPSCRALTWARSNGPLRYTTPIPPKHCHRCGLDFTQNGF